MAQVRKVISLFFVFLVLSGICFSQTKSQIDSLERRLSENIPDSTRLDILNALSATLVDQAPEKSLNFAKQELTLSQKNKDKSHEAYSYLNLGNASFNLADYKSSLQYYLSALHLHEESGYKIGIANCCGSIGNVYLDLNQPDEAIKYFKRAAKIFSEAGKKRGYAATVLAMGNVYGDKKEYDKAIEQYNISLEIFREIGDKESEAVNLNNLSQVHEKINENDIALQYVMKALEIDQATGNLFDASLTLCNIGELYLKKGNDKNAIQSFQKALLTGKQINANDRVLDACKGLAKAYKTKGEFKQAFEAMQMAATIADTIFSNENVKQMAEMQARFDSEKKEKEISLLTKNKEIQSLENLNIQENLKKQRLFSYSIIAVLLLVAAFGFFVWRSYREKKKANSMLEEKNALIEEKNKEITDSILYAEKIQRAILPSLDHFKKYFPDSFVLFKPKDIVSGDFYWIAEANDHIFYATVDCTGHGVPGGFMSMLASSMLNEIIIEKRMYAPGEVLDILRLKIIMALNQGDYGNADSFNEKRMQDGMDMVLACVNKEKNVLMFAAANNPLMIVRDKKLVEYLPDKQPVGITGGTAKQFTQHTIEIGKGDEIFTFTDGYADQFGGEKGKKFKHGPLKLLLTEISGKPMTEQEKILHDNIENWKGNVQQIDDILGIGVRI